MIVFKSLSKEEQRVFLAIEKEFIVRPCLDRKDFVKILGMLIQKYKFKGGKIGDSIKGTLFKGW